MPGHLRLRSLPSALGLLGLVGSLALGTACRRTDTTGSTAPGAAEQTDARSTLWLEWQLLRPMVEVADSHADDVITDQIEAASQLLAEGKVRSAAQSLEVVPEAATTGLAFLRVARANLAAIHFTTCIRGTHWRLPEGEDDLHAREINMDPEAPLQPGDIDVEAMLVELDTHVKSKIAALSGHARIARARVAAFAAQCPATPEVATMAESVVLSDLAQLAAEGQLSPDLAHMWGVVQMQQFSPAAARPFLNMAKEGGFDDPSIDLLLATIALQLGEFEAAHSHAEKAEKRFAEFDRKEQQAEAQRIQGESLRRRSDFRGAEAKFKAALTHDSRSYTSMVGLARIALTRSGEAEASESFRLRVEGFLQAAASLEQQAIADAAMAIEALIMASGDPRAASGRPRLHDVQADDAQQIALDQALRSALLQRVEHEASAPLRGLRYYYAALLDLRLGDREAARGHALTAEIELADLEKPPVDPRGFIEHLDRV